MDASTLTLTLSLPGRGNQAAVLIDASICASGDGSSICVAAAAAFFLPS